MEGHIAKKGKRYYVVIDLDRDPITNKRQQKWFSGFKTKKAAQAELNKILYELQQNTFIIPSTETLREYLNYWLEQRKDNLSPTTLYGYKSIMKNHLIPQLGNIELNKLKPLHIQEYYSNRLAFLSPTTVLHHHRLLRKALNDAKGWQIIKLNPADHVEAPKPKKYKAKVLSVDEIKLLIKVLENTPLETPVLLTLFLGLRRGELLALEWADIDYDNKTITIQRNLVRGGESGNELFLKEPKTEKSIRTIPISDNILSLLKKQKIKQNENRLKFGKYYKENNYIFTTEIGNLINPAVFSHRFGDFLKKNDLKKIRLHDLRHTSATLMLQSKIPAKVASERLGHSNIHTTLDLYSHVLKEMEKEASDVLDNMIFNSK